MEIKICGLTQEKEAEYLNEAQVDYAGFVFYEGSKRNVTIAQAKRIANKLDSHIKKVAVTVAPDDQLLQQLELAEFDIIQIHGELSGNALEKISIPIWRAINMKSSSELESWKKKSDGFPENLLDKISALVIDGAGFGSGKTFHWSENDRLKDANYEIFKNKKFVLAGGLHADNIADGIRIFLPDIVDVSSGVEGHNGKDSEKIKKFVEQVRNCSS